MSDAERDGVKDHSIGQSAMFYTSFTVILMVSSLWIQFVQDLNVHPLQWYVYFVLLCYQNTMTFVVDIEKENGYCEMLLAIWYWEVYLVCTL